jgi:predicted oxidoreductase (fatty acid repression mutant protein)
MKDCPEEQIKVLLARIDEHFAHKEYVSSQVLRDIREDIKELKAQHSKYAEILNAWSNAKGFMKVTKWLFYLLLGIGATITAIKQLPITLR